MKWIAIVVGCVAALIAAVVAIGYLLPQGHLASRRSKYRASPETIFAIVTNFAAAPSWRSSIKSVELLPARDGKTSFREESSQGALTFVVEELDAPSKLVSRIVDNPAFGGTWSYELAPDATGTTLTITERGEVFNPVFRFISHFFFSQTATIDEVLAALGKKLGET